jgi:endonuclease YncB( thermonuclease family)
MDSVTVSMTSCRWLRMIAVAGSLVLTAPASAQPIAGKVIGVSDGDTVTILDGSQSQLRIRLAGIDAPESGQAFGNRSKQTLSDCAFGKQVTLDGDKTDRYGRTVSKVIANGVDCNLRQIELGVAWHYKKYESEQSAADRRTYAAAESVARSAQRGLWIDANAEAPWDWRATHTERTALDESRGECDCDAQKQCTGKRGAAYCMTATGRKKYLK